MQIVPRKNFNKQRLAKFVRQTAALNLVATGVAIGMTTGFTNWQTALSWRSIFISFVYSNCIGTLVSLAIVFVVSNNFGKSNFVRLIKLTVTIFAATFAGMILANVVFAVIGWSLLKNAFALSAGQIWFALTIAFIFGFSAYFYELSQTHLALARERLRQKELDAARSATLASEAQLASLESRLHPHFLFNTLNSIAALIREDADLAEKTVERLADLLRYSLDAHANQLVDLKQEIEITTAYLEIERARFGTRLHYEIEIEKQFSSVKVPPFALQTLVENSVKHVAAKRPGAIKMRIAARAVNNSLEIEVTDDGAGFSVADIKNGHGLDTLQKRLDAIFGDQTFLQIDKNVNFGRVFFSVPLTIEYEQHAAISAIAPARLSG